MAKMTLEDLTTQLTRAHGDQLTAVVLYGSAARGEHVKATSDLNVLVIVRSLTPATLRASAAAAAAWGKAGNPPPLILTDAEWASSRDVFAMEYADIQEVHRVLAGTLPAGPAVALADLRHQLEFEAMGKLLQFRRGILACDGDAKRELDLLTAMKGTTLVLFRTLLRAHGKAVPTESTEAVRQAAALADLDAAPFLEVVAHAHGTVKIAVARADEVLRAYHAGLQRFVAHVDALTHE
ncbi:MAG TPA: nucleotidyltransferase domain-containing protein [Gemmatimonadaceae bacterium]|nr:nucleotidyltransferase domain-containing protein [Gemmatimonadaceae bacterium]